VISKSPYSSRDNPSYIIFPKSVAQGHSPVYNRPNLHVVVCRLSVARVF
jgi:hypothetical protein